MIPRQLPLSPMSTFARGIEHPLDVPVQRPHDADPREHRRPAVCRHQDQGLHRRLPILGFVLGLRQLRDVLAGNLKGDELATAGKLDRLVEGAGSAHQVSAVPASRASRASISALQCATASS